MTQDQFLEGIAYAEDNYRNNQAPHLMVDKHLIPEMFDLTGKRILDFGCGMGGMSLWYANNWDCEVYGLDIDEHHIEIAKHLRKKYNTKNVHFQKRNILVTPFDHEELFDVVFLNDVVEHIEFPILEKIIQQLYFQTKDNGQVFVTFPPWHSPYASHVTHAVGLPWCQFLPKSILLNLIKQNNQNIVGDRESDLIEAFNGLNHLTYEKLLPIVQKAGFKVSFRKTHSILNRIPGLHNINLTSTPFKYLNTKEFILLDK